MACGGAQEGINEVKAAVKAARKSESEKKKRKKDDGVNTAVDASTVGPGELWFKGIAEHQKNTWDLESLKWEEFAQKHVDMPGVCTLGSEKNVLDANGPLMSLISFFTAEYSSHPFRLSRGRAYKSMQPEDDSVTDTDLFGSLRLSLKGTRRVLCYPLDHLLHVAGTHLSQAQADLPSACQMIRSPTWAIVKDTLANVPVRCATIGPGDLLITPPGWVTLDLVADGDVYGFRIPWLLRTHLPAMRHLIRLLSSHKLPVPETMKLAVEMWQEQALSVEQEKGADAAHQAQEGLVVRPADQDGAAQEPLLCPPADQDGAPTS